MAHRVRRDAPEALHHIIIGHAVAGVFQVPESELRLRRSRRVNNGALPRSPTFFIGLSFPTLDPNLPWGRCLTHIDTEGGRHD